MSELNSLYHELIIDHGRAPRNFGELKDAEHLEGFNPLCGDRLTLYLKIEDNKITDVKFKGQGCAISVASASLMTQALKGKTLTEAKQLFHEFHEMVTQQKFDADVLGKLAILSGIAEFPSRIKCATLAWHTLNAILQGKHESVTTESKI
jgi:nitrogen fixation protein NifU and related proteins